MKHPQQLKLIGYWNDKGPGGRPLFGETGSSEYANYPSPLELISPGWFGDEKTDLISYLRSGLVLFQYFGGSTCRFLCENRQLGGNELTDGVWIWPEGLAHYVEEHDVILPEEFVNYVRNNDYQIPESVNNIFEQNREKKWLSKNFFWMTRGKICWYYRLAKKGIDKSFWIKWGKDFQKKE